MKSNLKIIPLCVSAMTIAAVLSGCYDAGAVLAEQSAEFAVCTLDRGKGCAVAAPAGTEVANTSVSSVDDAIRVLGNVSTMNECEGFAAHAKSRSSKHIAQATINSIVVMPFGEVVPLDQAIKIACATPPYNVSLTVAKAP